MTVKTICIIPARGGSKGLPKKNVRRLAGRPLVHWPIKAALDSGVIDDILVTTDDEDIARCAREAGADVPFLRDPALAQDETTTEATLQDALLRYEAHRTVRYDIAVFLTCTDVFRDPLWITEAVNVLRENSDIESAFSACATHKNFWQKTGDHQWSRVLPWMRVYGNRQTREKTYREDTGLACASRAQLWREGRRIGDRVHLIVNDRSETAIDIHTEYDLFLAEQTIAYFKQTDPQRVRLFLEGTE